MVINIVDILKIINLRAKEQWNIQMVADILDFGIKIKDKEMEL